jgi:hypothetical protein
VLGFAAPLPALANNALLSRAGMFWLFFIQFEFAGSHATTCWVAFTCYKMGKHLKTHKRFVGSL